MFSNEIGLKKFAISQPLTTVTTFPLQLIQPFVILFKDSLISN